MDGDGEDKPTDAVTLVRRYLSDPSRIIFASRRRRSRVGCSGSDTRSIVLCHRALTGIEVRIGNFSIVPDISSAPSSSVQRIVEPLRGERRQGAAADDDRADGPRRASRRAIADELRDARHAWPECDSVFRELVGTRLLLASSAIAAAGVVALLLLLTVAATGRIAFNQQTAVLLTVIVLVALQALGASFVVAFSILGGRDQSSFLPIRDYHYFIDTVVPLNGER